MTLKQQLKQQFQNTQYLRPQTVQENYNKITLNKSQKGFPKFDQTQTSNFKPEILIDEVEHALSHNGNG